MAHNSLYKQLLLSTHKIIKPATTKKETIAALEQEVLILNEKLELLKEVVEMWETGRA